MSDTDNPAGRLRAIVGRGQSIKGDQHAAAAWAQLLGVPKEDKALLLQRIGCAMSLPADIREQVSAVDTIDPNVYLKWLPKVESAFSALNFQTKWQQFIQHFSDDVTYGLEICSDILSRQSPERDIDSDTLNSLYEDVQTLIDDVQSSEELSRDARVFILDHLLRVRDALEAYVILGITPLERELHATVGAAYLQGDVRRQTRDSQLGQRFWKMMGRIAVALTVITGALSIGQDAQVLLSPESDSDQYASSE